MDMAVVLPIPLGPSRPTTCPFLGTGNLYSLNEFLPYWCTISPSSSRGRPMILIASKGHLWMQMPHPTHSSSDMTGFPPSPMTIVSVPVLTGGQ